MTDQKLIERAMEARKMAYTPYSHFTVGAALLTKKGQVYTGCNIENASYSATNCAERTAIFKAVSEGERDFVKIAVVGGKEGKAPEICPPCGVCRQVVQEFCSPDFEFLLAKSPEEYARYTLKELFPCGFGDAILKGE